MDAIQKGTVLYERPPLEALPKTDVIPRGVYLARLFDVRRFTNAWGDRLAFMYEITEGEQAGKRVIQSTATALSKRSKLGQTVATLLGRELTDNEALYGYDPRGLIGTECKLVLGLAATRAGKPYTTVENILK